MKEDLYSIGEVCCICRVSASKLRYYDEIGVIKPAKVDEENGYRYYGREVLLELPILFFLKDLGFSLKEAQQAPLLIQKNGSVYGAGLCKKRRAPLPIR